MRVLSSHFRSIPTVISPRFNPIGSSVLVCSLQLFSVRPNFGAFWTFRNPASLDRSLVLSSYPKLSNKIEQYFSRLLSPGDHS